jgi:hypothetical protein
VRGLVYLGILAAILLRYVVLAEIESVVSRRLAAANMGSWAVTGGEGTVSKDTKAQDAEAR